MATFWLKSQGVNPWPSGRFFSLVSAPICSSVLDDSSALRPRFYRVPLAASCDQPFVREALALGGIHERIKALRGVIGNVPFVQPERELIDVAEQVLFAGVVIDTVQAALQNSPDALDALL